jgi:hypothetical protein
MRRAAGWTYMESSMKPYCVAFTLVSACLLLLHPGTPAVAQQPKQNTKAAPAIPPPPQPKQVALTSKQIESFIAAQKDIAAITKKIPATSAKPDPKIGAQLDSAAKKHGFKSFIEYDDVAGTIALVMSGIDPVTKTFVEPKEAIGQEIAEVNADKSIGKAERTKMLQDLNRALKDAQSVQHRGNIDLVKSYFDKIEAAVQ